MSQCAYDKQIQTCSSTYFLAAMPQASIDIDKDSLDGELLGQSGTLIGSSQASNKSRAGV